MSAPNPVPYLVVVNLLEMIALPFHLLSFLLRRGAIRARIRRQLESQWSGRRPR